jgi:hypothetical protein
MPVALMDANLGQPRVQAGTELELGKLQESRQKNFLKNVLDFRIVDPDEINAKAVKFLPMGLIELKLRPFVPLQDLFDQFPLVQKSPYPLLSAVPGKYIPETLKTIVLKNKLPLLGERSKKRMESPKERKKAEMWQNPPIPNKGI